MKISAFFAGSNRGTAALRLLGASRRFSPKLKMGGYRIASLSATPRIRTNIFSKQLDCVESEEDGERVKRTAGGGRLRSERQARNDRKRKAGKKREDRKGTLCPGQWWLCIAKGCQIAALPPCVSSYLFLLAGTTRPRALREDRREKKQKREREREEEEKEEEEEEEEEEERRIAGLSIFIMFAPKKERRRCNGGGKGKGGKQTGMRNAAPGIHGMRRTFSRTKGSKRRRWPEAQSVCGHNEAVDMMDEEEGNATMVPGARTKRRASQPIVQYDTRDAIAIGPAHPVCHQHASPPQTHSAHPLHA
ncbi:hypothetical protein K0M31_001548 [Melipona bicolor]|uniref:Uncharacterized protein n=1 Tax=Melipona bicolor TaxID=60889 RepID=A0AA40GGW7_9HYME|nr:hypothetical protein K0M31_001548 [Melipona bicolor]